MKMMSGLMSLTWQIAHCQKATGTIWAMSQRKPSTPFAAQNLRMSSILVHVGGIGEKWVLPFHGSTP